MTTVERAHQILELKLFKSKRQLHFGFLLQYIACRLHTTQRRHLANVKKN